ncbi:hypothetical protein Taro_038005 [Colocasia esculenta]|uniref:alpha-1,2-Mannosidase n=1 Tax=Colocasia esculenta TaxID=4460 RepID=A0A843WCN2_COLES|nr:hypothetical protein [Colocasia esculenta]
MNITLWRVTSLNRSISFLGPGSPPQSRPSAPARRDQPDAKMTQRARPLAPHTSRTAVLVLVLISATLQVRTTGEGVTPSEARELREEVRGMFYHAFDGYLQHAFPLDELRPLSCTGEDTLGGYALTLIDSLDTLALLGDHEHFAAAVEWIGNNLRFDISPFKQDSFGMAAEGLLEVGTMLHGAEFVNLRSEGMVQMDGWENSARRESLDLMAFRVTLKYFALCGYVEPGKNTEI